jgi:hypothetical protein
VEEVDDMLLRRFGNGSEWGVAARVHPVLQMPTAAS